MVTFFDNQTASAGNFGGQGAGELSPVWEIFATSQWANSENLIAI
jgi:hypothetical protein